VQLLQLISFAITLCYILLLARIVLGFVLQYMTMQGKTVPDALGKVYDVVFMLTEPVLGPIRRILPQLGMIDLSPLVVMIILVVVQRLLTRFLV
jgi:YggT family protein